MTSVVTSVLATVNAPYGANLSAHQLAAKIVDSASLETFDAPVFAFFSEVDADLQNQFIDIMGVDHDQAHWMADQLAAKAGYALPLAAQIACRSSGRVFETACSIIDREGEDYVVAALRQYGPDRCAAAMRVAEAMAPELAVSVIGPLMYRERHLPLIRGAQTVTQAALRASLA